MAEALITLSDQLAGVVERAGRSVVAVHGRPRIPSSGLLWREGVVVTANHTLTREDTFRVTLADGSTIPAELAGRDPGTDLAVLKAAGANGPALTSADDLRVGSLVLGVGRYHDNGVSATLGVVSGAGGPWTSWMGGQLDRLLRVDLSPYPGASGGAVVDAAGRLAGVLTSGLSRHFPLAIPVATISRVADQLLSKGRIARGYLGIGLQPVGLPEHLKSTLNISTNAGLMVVSVEPESPAGRAGVFLGDILVGLGGASTEDMSDVQGALGGESIGNSIEASFVRAGEIRQLNITVEERPRRSR